MAMNKKQTALLNSKIKLLKEIERSYFMDAYLEALIFTEEERVDEEYAEWCEEHDKDDRGWGTTDITVSSLKRIIKDCKDFQKACKKAGIDLNAWGQAEAGHDFWLTRNYQGVGFWDRRKKDGDALTEIAESFGQVSAYVIDNGQVEIGLG